jgi:hypothetical protein
MKRAITIKNWKLFFSHMKILDIITVFNGLNVAYCDDKELIFFGNKDVVYLLTAFLETRGIKYIQSDYDTFNTNNINTFSTKLS